MSILITILMLSVIIVVHEFGHYIAARKNGILVEEFAVGMGPILFSKKKGDTLFSLRAIPLGGFCKMLGEDEDDSEEDSTYNYEDSYNSKSVFQRIVVIGAGSVLNFVLAFVIVLVLVLVNGFVSPTIGTITDGYPAQAAGLLPNDRIVQIDGSNIRLFQDVRFALLNNGETPIEVVINRDGTNITKTITPIRSGNNYMLGFSGVPFNGIFGPTTLNMGGEIIEITADRAGLLESISVAFWRVVDFIRTIIWAFGQLLTFNLTLNDMAGPLGVVNIIDDAYQATVEINLWYMATQILTLAALFSANIGVFNLLPFPALDGGRLVFLGIEAVRGKPINPEKEGYVHVLGFVLLIGFAIIVTFNDITRLFR